MKPGAHPRRSVALAMALLAAAFVAVLLAGCGSGNGSSGGRQSASDFIREVTTQFSRGQTGPLWDTLHPGDQAVVSRARYQACQSNEGFDLRKFTVLQSYADTVYVAGKATPSTAVTAQVTSDDGVTTATMHAVSVHGRWRWVLSPRDYTAYRHGKCP